MPRRILSCYKVRWYLLTVHNSRFRSAVRKYCVPRNIVQPSTAIICNTRCSPRLWELSPVEWSESHRSKLQRSLRRTCDQRVSHICPSFFTSTKSAARNDANRESRVLRVERDLSFRAARCTYTDASRLQLLNHISVPFTSYKQDSYDSLLYIPPLSLSFSVSSFQCDVTARLNSSTSYAISTLHGTRHHLL